MRTLQYNFSEFLERMMDEPKENCELFQVLEHLPETGSHKGVWVAGGAIRRTLLQQGLDSDVDLFFRNSAVLKEYRAELEVRGATLAHENEHQETFKFKADDTMYIIQLVKIDYYTTAEDVLDSFDFTITQFLLDGDTLYCGEYSLWDLSRKRLVLHRLTYGVATMRRMLKYTNQGFTACAGVMQSILQATADEPEKIKSEVKYVD